jgi:hypothetical protein
MAVGREIAEKTDGPDSADWTFSYNLGTRTKPGDKAATAGEDDPDNHGTAAQVIGDDAVVGFCGSCDPVKLRQRFKNGIATNVGGDKPGKRLTAGGWHIAAAKGLPNRFITSVAMDPADHRTIYATLGSSAARYWAPLGSQGEDAADAAGGYVYKSTDAGQTFTDITGDLPKVQATWVLVRNNQLIVADEVGVFASATKAGQRWAPLGDDLPPVPTYSMSLKPGDPNTLVAATYGRGVYTYSFKNGSGSSSPCSTGRRPGVRITTKARKASRSRKVRLRGRATATKCPRKAKVRRVQVALQKDVGRRGKWCRPVNRRGRLVKARSCKKHIYRKARRTSKWSFALKRKLPRGRYVALARAIDAGGKKSKVKRLRFRVR